ncbi:hypothetical protein BsWGS_07617 [Bradybaena similaris]
MKDLRLPAAVTIPAAIGLVGVLWLLRRKSSSGDGNKKTHKAVLEEKECASESNNQSQFDEQIEPRQITDMIVPQQKIPETLVCDNGTFGLQLESLCLSQSSVSSVRQGLGKPDVESYRHLNKLHQSERFKSEFEQCDQVESMVSDSVYHIGQVNSSVSADLIQHEQIDSLAVSSLSSSVLGVSTADAQSHIGASAVVMDVKSCVEGSGLPSSLVENVQAYGLTESGQGDGLLPVNTIQDDQAVILTSSDAGQNGHCGNLASDSAQDGQHSSLALPDTPQDGQHTSLALPDTPQDGQCSSLTSSDTTQNSQHSRLISSDVDQDGLCDSLSSPDVDQDGLCDSLTSPDVDQDGLCDSLSTSDGTQDRQSGSLISFAFQQHDQSSPLKMSEVQQDDDLVASDANQDDHYASFMSSSGHQDSQYGSLLSSYGQLEGNCDSQMSSPLQQDDQFDSLMSSYNAQDSEFGSQVSLDAAQHVGLRSSSLTECDQGNSLTISQKAYIEQQIITAMGDGLEEACRQLCKSPGQSETSDKQMPAEAVDIDDFFESGSSDSCSETEQDVQECGDLELQRVVIEGSVHEDDLGITGTTDLCSDETVGVQSHAQIMGDCVCLEAETTVCGPEGSQDTKTLASANLEHLRAAHTEAMKSANTESLVSSATMSLESASSKNLKSASFEYLESVNLDPSQSLNTELLESANTEPLVSDDTESSSVAISLESVSVEYLEPVILESSQSHNIESLESANTAQDFEDAIPEVIQDGGKSLQEIQMPFSNSYPQASSKPHVHTPSEDLFQGSSAKDIKQDDQLNSLSVDSCLSAVSKSDADTDNTIVETTQGKSSSADKCIQSLPSEKMETRKLSSWLPKASSSSVDSFGPEEIEAIWGIDSSMVNLDEELIFLDSDPVVVPVDDKNVMNPTAGLGTQQVSAAASTVSKDNMVVATSTWSPSDTSCDNVSDPNVKDSALGKSISPVCDNNSEGSNDSGRGGSEHDMVGQGGEPLVQFNFCMPSELCGQFIGKHGKNINYLKTKSGAHVSLTSNAFMPEYQICQIVGTQVEVDDALSMIRLKFPLQDYKHLTMDPIDLSMPPPLQPDNQVVYPEVMQLSLPEGVSVEVFVSAVVDAGQVFVQQPTHRSYMSLDKMNYFLNLVYSQDPNVPSVPLPIESGVICVCESEGYWYRAMIMSPIDENGEVQLKFVDYGGYITLPVTSLKQIRVDFMNLPFQAVECFMANITPNQGEKLFSDEATQALCDLTQGKLLQCQVVARTEYGIPYIHLYQVNPERNSAVLINRALVNRRLVRWIEIL